MVALGWTAGVLSKELGRLRMLQLVAEALHPQQRAADGSSTQQPAAAAARSSELAEAVRLVQCAQVLTWLGQQQQRAFDRPTGRFFSEQEWRSVAARRRDGAATVGAGATVTEAPSH